LLPPAGNESVQKRYGTSAHKKLTIEFDTIGKRQNRQYQPGNGQRHEREQILVRAKK
jgi:hypothetical protein